MPIPAGSETPGLLLEPEEVDRALYIAVEGGFFEHSQEDRRSIPRTLQRILQLHSCPERNKTALDRLSPDQRAQILNLTDVERWEIRYYKDLIAHECLLDDALLQVMALLQGIRRALTGLQRGIQPGEEVLQVESLQRMYRQALAALQWTTPPDEGERNENRDT